MALNREFRHIAVISFLFSLFIFFFSSLKPGTVLLFWGLQVWILLLLLNKRPASFLKIKLYLVRALILLFALFFALLSIEAYLRIYRPAFLELNNSILGNFSDFTSRGYLDEKVFDKDRDEFRILGLGDSFAVELAKEKKNYHDFLEYELQKESGRSNVKVINAGMESTGPGYYRHILERYGDLIRPDLVLVGFFVGNDFSDMRFDLARYGNFIFEPIDKKERIFRNLRFKNFWLCQFFSNEVRYMQKIKAREKELLTGNALEEAFLPEDIFLETEYIKSWIFDVRKAQNLKELWDLESRVILKMKEFCDRRNIPLVIAIFPDEFQVEEETRNQVVKHYGLDMSFMDLKLPNELIAGFCSDHDIYALDLLGPFQEAAKSKRLYLVRNTHWNEAGNELAGKAIADFIRKKGE